MPEGGTDKDLLNRQAGEVDVAYAHAVPVVYAGNQMQSEDALSEAEKFAERVKAIPVDELEKMKFVLPTYTLSPNEGYVVAHGIEEYAGLLVLAADKLAINGHIDPSVIDIEIKRILLEEKAHFDDVKDIPGVSVVLGIRFIKQKTENPGHEKISFEPFTWASGMMNYESYKKFMASGSSLTDMLITQGLRGGRGN